MLGLFVGILIATGTIGPLVLGYLGAFLIVPFFSAFRSRKESMAVPTSRPYVKAFAGTFVIGAAFMMAGLVGALALMASVHGRDLLLLVPSYFLLLCLPAAAAGYVVQQSPKKWSLGRIFAYCLLLYLIFAWLAGFLINSSSA